MDQPSSSSVPAPTPDRQQAVANTAAATVTIDVDASKPAEKKKLRRGRAALAAVGRSVTKGPRMLGRRIKHFLQDELYVDVSFQKMPATEDTRELATMEMLAVYHRWLRGVQALMAILVFVLSLISIPGTETLVNATIFIISQACTMVISKTYQVKAQFSGVTNVLFEGRNIFTSPYLFGMIVEIIIWNIQTPPIVVFWPTFFRLLNYTIVIRLYSVLLYLSNAAYVYRTFCRAISAMADLPLSTSFLVRTALVYHKYRVGFVVGISSWLSIGFLYAKSELVSVSDGLWFSFQTLTTLGYGDVTPVTIGGRVVVIMAGICSFFMVAHVVVCVQSTLLATDAEYNMQVLAHCHDLTHTLRSRSAWVIQIAWRMHKARRDAGPKPTKRQQVKIILICGALTHIIAALRRTRQGLNATQRDFRETTVNPLTGLSSYQYTTYVYEAHRAARQLQRVKDIDRVHLALRDRSMPASSLSRDDIATILMPDGHGVLDSKDDAINRDVISRVQWLTSGGSGRGSARASFDGSGMWLRRESAQGSSGGDGPTAADVAAWKARMNALEEKCGRLSGLLEAMLAVADTHPPSMATSEPAE